MELPAFLPNHFFDYFAAKSDMELFDMLVKRPTHVILFFEFAAEDELWSHEHSEFMESLIDLLTKRFLQERLSMESAGRIAKAIQAHRAVLGGLVPENISIQVKDHIIPINSLLLGASSEEFHEMIRIQCRDRGQQVVVIHNVSEEFLPSIVEFVNTGDVATIWRFEQIELFRLLRQSQQLKISGLMKLCEDTLKRYINNDNVYEILSQSLSESWENLQQHCFDYLNTHYSGVRLAPVVSEFVGESFKEIKPLAFEFLEFGENALDAFSKLRAFITHLVIRGSLTATSEFSTVVRSCPKLVSLDISRTGEYSEHLTDIPIRLEELDLSHCPWLTDKMLKKMIEICPNLLKLSLRSDLQLTYGGLTELKKLRYLKALDLTRSHQLRDEDLSLILSACSGLTQLVMEDCPQLSNKAYFDLSRRLPLLALLNIARTSISDSLVLEIVTHCMHLRYLNVSHCREITGKGILQVVRQGQSLQVLDVRDCRLTREDIEQVKEARPLLKVLS